MKSFEKLPINIFNCQTGKMVPLCNLLFFLRSLNSKRFKTWFLSLTLKIFLKKIEGDRHIKILLIQRKGINSGRGDGNLPLNGRRFEI